MTAMQYLRGLGPALPLSPQKDGDGRHQPMTGGDIRRLCSQRAVLFNGEPVDANEPIDFPVHSLVFYPP